MKLFDQTKASHNSMSYLVKSNFHEQIARQTLVQIYSVQSYVGCGKSQISSSIHEIGAVIWNVAYRPRYTV